MFKRLLHHMCVLAVISLCFTTVVRAESITIAAEDDWVPYARADGTGLANEMVKAAFKTVGIDVTYQVFPYIRVLSYLDSGEYVAGFNVPLDDENKDKYIFGKQRLYDVPSQYFVNKSAPLKATKREELVNGEKIGIVRGYGYGDAFNQMAEQGKVRSVISNSDSINLKKQASNRLDPTIIFEKSAGVLLKELGLEDQIEVAFVHEILPIYLAFSKAHPKGQYYSDKFDEGMANLKASGEYQKIYDSY